MEYQEMREIVIDVCGDGIVLSSEEVEITYPNGTKGTDTIFTCWYRVDGNKGILYSYGSEVGIMEIEEKTYDQIFPRAEVKRGRLPKDVFIDSEGVRRYRSIYR